MSKDVYCAHQFVLSSTILKQLQSQSGVWFHLRLDISGCKEPKIKKNGHSQTCRCLIKRTRQSDRQSKLTLNGSYHNSCMRQIVPLKDIVLVVFWLFVLSANALIIAKSSHNSWAFSCNFSCCAVALLIFVLLLLVRFIHINNMAVFEWFRYFAYNRVTHLKQ